VRAPNAPFSLSSQAGEPQIVRGLPKLGGFAQAGRSCTQTSAFPLEAWVEPSGSRWGPPTQPRRGTAMPGRYEKARSENLDVRPWPSPVARRRQAPANSATAAYLLDPGALGRAAHRQPRATRASRSGTRPVLADQRPAPRQHRRPLHRRRLSGTTRREARCERVDA
jgi:hypothetical protein